MYSGILAITLTLTEELFTGHVELLSDCHIRLFNLCFATFNNYQWIFMYLFSQVKAALPCGPV